MSNHRIDTKALLRVAALALVLAGPGLVAPAGAADSIERIDLAGSIARSLEAHPDLGPQRARVLEAQADLARAEAGRYPTGELTSAFAAIPGAEVGEVPDGLPEELAPLFSKDKDTDLTDDLGFFTRNMVRVTLPIYTFGKISNGIDAATYGLEAVESELERTRADVVLEVKRIYYGHQLATVLMDLLEEIASSFDEAVDQAQERLEAGEGGITQGDVLKLKLARGRTQAQVLKLRNESQLALAAYRRALGLAPDAPVAPVESRLEPVKVAPLDELGDLEAGIVDLPEWHAVSLGLKAKEHEAEVARGKLYPDFFVGGVFNYSYAPGRDNLDNPFLYDPYNFLEGGAFLGLRYDLDFWGNTARADRASAEVVRLQAERNRARIGLPLRVRRAYLAFEEARDGLVLARTDRKSGRALAFLATTNFGIGIGDGREILESLGLYTKAATDYHRAVHDFNVSVAELSKAVGRELAVDLIVAADAAQATETEASDSEPEAAAEPGGE